MRLFYLMHYLCHEDTLTHSCRLLHQNKIEQLPSGIFSDLSELRDLKVFFSDRFVANVQD